MYVHYIHITHPPFFDIYFVFFFSCKNCIRDGTYYNEYDETKNIKPSGNLNKLCENFTIIPRNEMKEKKKWKGKASENCV